MMGGVAVLGIGRPGIGCTGARIPRDDGRDIGTIVGRPHIATPVTEFSCAVLALGPLLSAASGVPGRVRGR